MPKFSVETLTTDDQAVARIIAADDLFTLISRSVTVPAGWVALVSSEGQDPLLVRSGGQCEAGGALDVLFVRAVPIECAAEESSLRSTDGYECCGSIRLRVRVMEKIAELAAFRKTVVGSSDSVCIADLQRYLHWQMSKLLTELAGGRTAAELLQPLDASMVRGLAEDKLGAVCLAGGLTIDGPVAVRFESSAYQEHCRDRASDARQQQRLTARTQIQQALASAQGERLTHLVKMLEQMNEASALREDVGVAELLQAFTEAERGELYGALWHLCPSARATRFVAAVSGSELLLFEPADLSCPAQRIQVPDDLGLLRSVGVDKRALEAGHLMIGAARGVHLADMENGRIVRSLSAEVPEQHKPRGGVNAVAMSSDYVFATHSQLGLMAWRGDDAGDEPGHSLHAELTRGASTVRCVQVADLHLWFAVEQTLFAVPLDDVGGGEPIRHTASGSTLSAATVAAGRAYAGNVDGQIIAWDVGEPESARIVRGQGGGPVESIDVIQTGGVDRLIVADRSTALMATVVGDGFTCRYESGSQIVRRAAAADDLFVAMNDNRDRLMIWSPREPKQPAESVIIPHLTGNTVQDVCLVPIAG